MQKLISVFPWIVVALFAVFCGIVLLTAGCASLSPKPGLVLDVAAQNAGYVIMKENANIGKAALALCEVTELKFKAWSDQIADLLVDDEFLAMNFKKLLTAVQVDIEGLDKLKDQIEVYSNVKESFCHGLEVGIQKKP